MMLFSLLLGDQGVPLEGGPEFRGGRPLREPRQGLEELGLGTVQVAQLFDVQWRSEVNGISPPGPGTSGSRL